MSGRRGMTIVELLASLGLLTVLMIVCLSWTTATMRRQAEASERARWARAAHAVLDCVAQDLRNEDGLDPALGGRVPRVAASQATLDIRTCDVGWLGVARYGVDGGALRRLRQGRREAHGTPMVGDIERFEASIEPASDARAMPVLTVELRSVQGWSAARVYTLSPGDVR